MVIVCPTHGIGEAIRGDIGDKLWCLRCLEAWEGGLDCLFCWHCEELLDDYYMVHDEVWVVANLPEYMCQVHLRCLEERLGRHLHRRDFTDAPVNDDVQGWLAQLRRTG